MDEMEMDMHGGVRKGGALKLDRYLRDDDDLSRRERILSRISARRQVSRPMHMPRRAVLAMVAALAICFLVLGIRFSSSDHPTQETSPLHIQGGAVLARLEVPTEASRNVTYELSDGSSIEVAPGGTLSTTENSDQRASLVLVSGEATFDIAPSKRRWTIDAGLASVEVLGTRFVVHRRARDVSITVERGRVRLRSEHIAGGERLLLRGESEQIALGVQREEPASVAVSEVMSPEAVADAEPMSPPWDDLARRGQFDLAYRRLGSRGIVERVERSQSIEELLLLADVARLSGHPREAVAPLEQAVAQYRGHRQAAVAAFTLGRLHADVLSDSASAVTAFERCLALGPPGALHSDALARLAEARNRAGDRQGARAAAREYLERYPEGQRARFLGTLLDR